MRPYSEVRKLVSDIVSIAMSKEKLKGRLRVPLYRNALYLMINAGITAMAGFAFWILAARLYSAEDVGLASATISAMMLLASFATLGLDYSLIRFLPNSGKKSNPMINSGLTLSGLSSIFFALVFVAGLGFWSRALLFLQRSPIQLCAFVVFTVGWTLYLVVQRTFVAMRLSGFALAQNGILQVIKIVAVILLATFLGAFGIFASWGISQITAVLIGTFIFLPRIFPRYRPSISINGQIVKEMAHYSFSNYVANLLWNAPALILPIMVVNLVGTEDNAFFYIAWAIANVLFAIPVGTSLSLFADSSHDTQKTGQNVQRSLKLTLLILIPSIALISLIGAKLLHIFGAAYSENATELLWILGVSALPLSLNSIYFSTKRVEMKMKGVIAFNAFITVATLALSWVLMPHIGILGAGVAWLSSQSAVALIVIILWLNRRKESKPTSTGLHPKEVPPFINTLVAENKELASQQDKEKATNEIMEKFKALCEEWLLSLEDVSGTATATLTEEDKDYASVVSPVASDQTEMTFRELQWQPPLAAEDIGEKKGVILYNGSIELLLPAHSNLDVMFKLLRRLRGIPRTKILNLSVSPDKSIVVSVFLERPTSLLSIVEAIPGVEGASSIPYESETAANIGKAGEKSSVKRIVVTTKA
jgi:O-antigen/teichoic acid export membrane protein